MGSGKSNNGALMAMMIQQQQQKEAFDRQLAEQQRETDRLKTSTEQNTNASQKANAISTERQDNAVRSQGMISKGGSANATVKNKLGGALGSEEKNKEAWY